MTLHIPGNRMAGPKSTAAKAGGFTLVESIISVLLVGAVLVAAMNTVGASQTGQYTSLERFGGNLLADSMIAEIVNQDYEEPDDIPVFGREAGEIATQRDQWDDVDDYNGWSASPVQRRDGTEITSSEWSRRVTVDWVAPGDLSQIASGETGAKKITVTINHRDRVIATRTAVRTIAR